MASYRLTACLSVCLSEYFRLFVDLVYLQLLIYRPEHRYRALSFPFLRCLSLFTPALFLESIDRLTTEIEIDNMASFVTVLLVAIGNDLHDNVIFNWRKHLLRFFKLTVIPGKICTSLQMSYKCPFHLNISLLSPVYY